MKLMQEAEGLLEAEAAGHLHINAGPPPAVNLIPESMPPPPPPAPPPPPTPPISPDPTPQGFGLRNELELYNQSTIARAKQVESWPRAIQAPDLLDGEPLVGPQLPIHVAINDQSQHLNGTAETRALYMQARSSLMSLSRTAEPNSYPA